MGLSSLVNSLVATAKEITETLQAEIQLYRFTGDADSDEKIAGSREYEVVPELHDVFIAKRTKFVGIEGGIQSVVVSSVQFMEPMYLTVRDKIVLPGGEHPQIIAVEGAMGPDGKYYAPKAVF